ncbi:MAG: hypothetical protein U1F25_09890 [Rubrivivax sp.]
MPGPSRASCARPFIERQAALVERLRGIGAQDIQPLWLEHALALEMPRSRVKDVAQWPAIRRVQSDFVLRGPARPSLAARGDPWPSSRTSRPAPPCCEQPRRQRRLPRCKRPQPAKRRKELAEHLAAIDAPRAWLAGLDGRGTTVAVVDSSVDLRVPALA